MTTRKISENDAASARRSAALALALLDEMREDRAARFPSLSAQAADELGRLGQHLLRLAARIARECAEDARSSPGATDELPFGSGAWQRMLEREDADLAAE